MCRRARACQDRTRHRFHTGTSEQCAAASKTAAYIRHNCEQQQHSSNNEQHGNGSSGYDDNEKKRKVGEIEPPGRALWPHQIDRAGRAPDALRS